MENENIFQRACLIQLSTSIWQGSRIVSPAVMKKMGQKSEWLRGRKYLVNPELLGPVKTASHQARNTINKFALPFPINGISLIPKESLTVVDEALHGYRERFWSKVRDFEAVYGAAREEAQGVLGELFNEADYPTDILRKFRFEWRFLVLGLPGQSMILSPEIYEREVKKFREMMEETRNMAVTALAQEFSKVVENLVERLKGDDSGKPRIINGAMFNKLNEFLDNFSTKNIFDDARLAELTEQAREVIGGVSSFGLKYDTELRESVNRQMSELKEAIDGAIEDLPRRKLRIAA